MGKEPVWKPNWDSISLAEGWLLSADDRIERDDDSDEFKDDDEALAYVRRMAATGSKMHQAALYYHEAGARGRRHRLVSHLPPTSRGDSPMTGEMSWIKPDGEASDGSVYEIHAHVARELGCELRPFDTYIGPYIAHPKGKVWLSTQDGFHGEAVVWPGGEAPAYREPIVVEFFNLYNQDEALAAVREALDRCP